MTVVTIHKMNEPKRWESICNMCDRIFFQRTGQKIHSHALRRMRDTKDDYGYQVYIDLYADEFGISLSGTGNPYSDDFTYQTMQFDEDQYLMLVLSDTNLCPDDDT